MKDMNEVDTVLGIKVKKHSGGYALNQCHYISKLLDKFKHLGIKKKTNSPYNTSVKLFEDLGIVVAQLEYAIAVGSLINALHYMKMDIAYVVCKLSTFTSKPNIVH